MFVALIAMSQALYSESLRPQFHFTAQKGWLNDPNGLVFHDGEYHLFFQHNPDSTEWGNMTWGHAVSKDLVHWRQIEHALLPDKRGTMYSGSAVTDPLNTSGLGADIIAFYTAAGGKNPESNGQPFTQGLAYSRDNGRTFTKLDAPIINHIVAENRDPKVDWHEPTKSWVMALYLDGEAFVLFTSKNLKNWTEIQRFHMPGSAECPDFFEMPVIGSKEKRWVFTGANGRYWVGKFDGKRFTPEAEPRQVEFGGNNYAVQSYYGLPNQRRVQIGWMNGGRYPGMPFNQQMTFPCDLTLRRGADGLRVYRYPVPEISRLWEKTVSARLGGRHTTSVTGQAGSERVASHLQREAPGEPNLVASHVKCVAPSVPNLVASHLERVAPSEPNLVASRLQCETPSEPNLVASHLQCDAPTSAAQTLTITEIQSELLDVEADLRLDGKAKVSLNGTEIEYDPITQTLSCLGRTAFLPLEKNRLKLRVLVDRTSVEVFANDGRVSLSTCRMPTTDRRISFSPGKMGEADVKVRSLKSAWTQ